MEVLTFFFAVCKTYARENPPPQNGQKKGSGYLYFMYLKLLVITYLPPITPTNQKSLQTPFDKLPLPGALSIFEANSQFYNSSCPTFWAKNSSWWQEASSQLGFWTFEPWILAKIKCNKNTNSYQGGQIVLPIYKAVYRGYNLGLPCSDLFDSLVKGHG